MNIAFAGFRHGHIMGLYKSVLENPETTLTGCFEEDKTARHEAENNGVRFNYSSYDDILNDSCVDAIAIGDYFAKRGGLIIAALKAGKHVICDKPLCTSLSELDEIERLVKEKNLIVSCMLDLRYMPQIATVRRLIADGEIGDIVNVSFTGQHCLDFGNRPEWYFEKGKQGGTINDIAIHGVDLVRFLTGTNLTKVNCARTWNAYAKTCPDFSDCAQFMAEFENVSLLADVSYSAPKFCGMLPTYWDFYFWGTEGMINFNLKSSTIHIYKSEEKIVECKPCSPQYLRDFLLEIKGNKTIMDTADILQSQRQVLKIQKAAEGELL